MADRKGYLNTDELQADDEISPRPSDDRSGRGRADAENGEADDTARVPRAATSE